MQLSIEEGAKLTTVDEDDFAELLGHIRDEMRTTGLQELDDQVRAAHPAGDTSARELALRYLEALATRIALTSSHSVTRILVTLNEHVVTEDGNPMDDVQVLLDRAAQLSTGTEVISLSELPDRRRELAALRLLRSQLMEG